MCSILNTEYLALRTMRGERSVNISIRRGVFSNTECLKCLIHKEEGSHISYN